MDLLPGASLEFRVYVLLGIVGVMFFAAILALGVGRLVAMRSSSNVSNIAETSNSPFGGGFDAPDKTTKREKKTKPVKAKKEKLKTADEIFQDDEPVEEVEYERKVSFFGKKKKEAVEMLAKPSGYVDEYAPSHTRNTEDEFIPEYESLSVEESVFDNSKKESDWADDFLTEEVKSETEDNKRKDKNSPFGGNADWEF
jgi:hypothetical protein